MAIWIIIVVNLDHKELSILDQSGWWNSGPWFYLLCIRHSSNGGISLSWIHLSDQLELKYLPWEVLSIVVHCPFTLRLCTVGTLRFLHNLKVTFWGWSVIWVLNLLSKFYIFYALWIILTFVALYLYKDFR